MTLDRELEPDSESLQHRMAGPELTQAGDLRADAPKVMVVLSRLQRDVIAEPFGLLVRVGVATDVDEQGRVIQNGPVLGVEPDPLTQPQRDEALAQDVLHGLTEPEIDAE